MDHVVHFYLSFLSFYLPWKQRPQSRAKPTSIGPAQAVSLETQTFWQGPWAPQQTGQAGCMGRSPFAPLVFNTGYYSPQTEELKGPHTGPLSQENHHTAGSKPTRELSQGQKVRASGGRGRKQFPPLPDNGLLTFHHEKHGGQSHKNKDQTS